jgi:ribosome-binding factor A
MDSVRQSKIARLLQKELATYFQSESRNLLPGKLITVTAVRVSPDLGIAKVYLSVFPHKPEEDVIEPITAHNKHIRNTLGQHIRHQVRVIPELAFYIDDSMDYVERIEKLLKK